MTRFVFGATTLQFNQDPIRGSEVTATVVQATGMDSAGNHYAYTKSQLRKVTRELVFSRLTDTVVSSLRTFFSATVDGGRLTFTWYDHADTARTVRFAGQIGFEPSGPGRKRVTMTIIEDVA